jgi:hypothetical protein
MALGWLRGKKPISDAEPKADPVLELAYTAAIKALEQQDDTLGNLRNRATGLLSAVTIATTFSAGLGLFSADATKGPTLPTWAQWTLLGLLLVTSGLSIAVMWPKTIAFGVDPRLVLKRHETVKDFDGIRRYVIDEAVKGHGRNQKVLKGKFRLYKYAVIALAAEASVLLLALILKGK